MIHQGEIRDYITASGRGRALVLSNDEVNEDGFPVLALIQGGAPNDNLAPYLVALSNEDPVSGTVNITRIGYASPSAVGDCAGLVTRATWRRVLKALGDLFDDS